MDSPESDREKVLFRNPFSLYSNVRNAYKGIRKTRPMSAHYEVAGTDQHEEKGQNDLTGFDHGHDLGLNSLDDGCIVVAVNPLNSLESTEDHCGSPSPRSDGNTTDDSGIDSISEKIDKLVHEAALKQESERRRSLLAFALGDYPASAEIKSSPAAKAKSVLQETYGSLKRHTTAMDAPWKRDFILSHAGLKKSASRDNLLVEKGGPVELTGMKSKVKETVQALETKFSQSPGPLSPPDVPVYSVVNKLGKKNKRKEGEATAEAEFTIPPVESAEVSDLSEITKLLTNTSDLLSRSGHLRASLTVSVRHPSKPKGQTTTFVFPANANASGGGGGPGGDGTDKKAKRLGTRVQSNASGDYENVASPGAAIQGPMEKGISWYERENLRIASKLEKEGAIGGFKLVDASQGANSDDEGKEDDSDDDAPKGHFMRFDPIKPKSSQATTLGIRRSVRLPPKTVANLASKFDNLNLLSADDARQDPRHDADGGSGKHPGPEVELKKNDISKIIDTLNKLDDEAKKSSARIAPKRPTLATSSKFFGGGIARKSQRQKHGFSLATKSVDLAKKNSTRRPQPVKKEVKIVTESVEIETVQSCDTESASVIALGSDVGQALPVPAKRTFQTTLTERYLSTLLGEPAEVFHEASNADGIATTEPTPACSTNIEEPVKPSITKTIAPYDYEDVGEKSATIRSSSSSYEIVEPRNSAMQAKKDYFGSNNSVTSVYDYVRSPLEDKGRGQETAEGMARSSSEDNLSQFRYEPIEPVFIAKARPAIVVEDQADSISYVYGDECLRGGREGPGLYESIAGSFLNIARNKLGIDAVSVEDLYTSLTKLTGEHHDVDRQEMLSLSLEKWTAAHWSTSNSGSSVRSSNRSSEIKSVMSDKSDEWIDLEEDEEDTDSSRTSRTFGRVGFRSSQRGKIATWSTRMSKRPWTTAGRTLAVKSSPTLRDGFDLQQDQFSNTGNGEDDVYESIYEVIPQHPDDGRDYNDNDEAQTSERDPKTKNGESPSLAPGLTKFAEAAGKKMKKLRRNWSLKKNDISRSLSRIRKYSTGGRAVVANQQTITLGGDLRRKPSRRIQIPDAKSVVRQHGGPVVGDGSPGDTTFYITLTIEQEDDDEEDEEESRKDENSKFQGSLSSATEIETRSQTISVGSSSLQSGSSKTPDSWTTSSYFDSSPFSSRPGIPCPPRRKSHKPSLVRPTQAPPDPPPVYRRTHSTPIKPNFFTSSSPTYQPDSLLLCDSIRDLTNATQALGSPCSEEDLGSSGSEMSAFLLRDQLEENYTSSLFQTEPLYQFYNEDIHGTQKSIHLRSTSVILDNSGLQNSSMDSGNVPIENMYECIDRDNDNYNSNSMTLSSNSAQFEDPHHPEPPLRCRKKKATPRPSAMDIVHSVDWRRSFWVELPEVVESGILNTISPDRKKLQEAMFEVITSEASYLKSINVLIWHFAHSPRLVGDPPFEGTNTVLSKRDHKTLFSDIFAVRQCSEKFLEDLEKRWQSSVLLEGLCEVVKQHAEQNFHIYIKYCSNQVYQDRILKKLRSDNPKFVEVLRELESSPVCQSLAMHSFLMLPMQRITRLPLLLTAIYNRLNSESSEYLPCKEALQTLNKLVKECNESARNMERMEEMLILNQQLDFKEVKAVPLISASRWLVKRGDATRIWWKENVEAKLTFGRRINRQSYTFFLFTDLLMITKRKSDDSYLVVDYCPRNLVQLGELDSTEKIVPGGRNLSEVQNYFSWMTLLQNHENKTVEWLVAFNTECERRRWIESFVSQSSKNPEEKIYEDWDCPIVEAVVSVKPKDAGEISLEKGEKANVLRKLSDSGWCYIERRLDGAQGWIPMSAIREIDSNHVRARNYKQRHAFLKLLSSSDINNQPSN